jgi:hypothetical protein
MRATKRRPGYHKIYGEVTKHVLEASVFNDQLSMVWWDGETMRPDLARLYVPGWRTRMSLSMVDLPFSSIILCRQG